MCKRIHGVILLIPLLFLSCCQLSPNGESPYVQGNVAAKGSATTSPTEINPTLNEAPVLVTDTVEGDSPIIPEEGKDLKITILYDNYPYDPRLGTAWGFSALVEYYGRVLLFDTGGDPAILLNNMQILGIDPAQVEMVIISHDHGDHTGGLEGLLERNPLPTIYVIPSYSASSRRRISNSASVVDVSPGQQIAEGVFTTGEMGGEIPEQALLLSTDRGLVVITGCAHPGIVQMVQDARERLGDPIHLVMGGFHLGDATDAELNSILAAFRDMGVETVAPSHCTGDRAIRFFEAEYKDDYIKVGAGKTIVVHP